MRSRWLLLLLSIPSAQAQYYTDPFTSNTGAWSYVGNSGLAFTASGLVENGQGIGGNLVAWNNGGNNTRQEIRATVTNLPSSGYSPVKIWRRRPI